MTAPATRRFLLLALEVFVALLCLGLLSFMYWTLAWGEGIHRGRRDFARYDLLCALLDAVESYREETGDYPPDLRALGKRYRQVPQPPLSGPDRVVYIPPGAEGRRVVLHSYGHIESRRGWNLRHDEVIWEIDQTGAVRELPVTGTR